MNNVRTNKKLSNMDDTEKVHGHEWQKKVTNMNDRKSSRTRVTEQGHKREWHETTSQTQLSDLYIISQRKKNTLGKRKLNKIKIFKKVWSEYDTAAERKCILLHAELNRNNVNPRTLVFTRTLWAKEHYHMYSV